MSYLERIRAGKYTESDVAQFYIENRFTHGPFVREVGDFVAHPNRDKGTSFEAIIGTYAQLAFYARYIFKKSQIELVPIGQCEWWLKPFFMWKLKNFPAGRIRAKLKLSVPELKKKINAWFPNDDRFPTRIQALNPFELLDVANLFIGLMQGSVVFDPKKVRTELAAAFKATTIPFEGWMPSLWRRRFY